MAARFAAAALLCQLLLATLVAAALAYAFGLRVLAAVPIALAAFYGIALALVTAPLVLAPPPEAPRGQLTARASTRGLMRALAREALVLDVSWATMALEPFRGSLIRHPRVGAARPRPVVLVHGFSCNRAVWRPLLRRLATAGFGPLRAVSLEPMFASVETLAVALLAELEDLVDSQEEREPVMLVTHSMGGLVARAALRHARRGLIARIITLGAPHHGTWVACRFHWANAREMCPGSRWLLGLNGAQEGDLPVPVTTLYSIDDNLILPASSARLEGARALEVHGLGHLTLLRSRRVFDCVISELLLPGAQPGASAPEAG